MKVGLAYITFKNQERAAQAKLKLEQAYEGTDLRVAYCKLSKKKEKEKYHEEDSHHSSLSEDEDAVEEVDEGGSQAVHGVS